MIITTVTSTCSKNKRWAVQVLLGSRRFYHRFQALGMENKARDKAIDDCHIDSNSNDDNNRKTSDHANAIAIDSPCWGLPTQCSLTDLLNVFGHDRSIVLLETDDYLVLNKPPDLRMDGDYPATVHKLLTYWYPPKSIQHDPNRMELISKLTKSNDLKDAELRPCHQLDYATSGALLVGRNRKAAGKACEAFRNRSTQKVYLALVHSHVGLLTTTTTTTTTTALKHCPCYETLTLKDLYHQIRIFDQQLADRRKAHRTTFKGYQPPYAIFTKWKSFVGRCGGKRPRDSDMMHRVEEQIAVEDRVLMSGMTWNDVKKNDGWRIVFEEASKVYNQSLQDDNEVQNDSEKLLELPSVFRLEEDGDANVFYVNASLAQHPTDFAMVIQQNAQQTTSPTDPHIQLDFKLAITRCTVLQHATLNSAPVTKMKLQPLTGRRHQLRCHMVVVNAPIVGDVTYEGNHNDCPSRCDLAERMCLHAFQLVIPGIVDTEAPDPFVISKKDNGAVDVVDVQTLR